MKIILGFTLGEKAYYVPVEVGDLPTTESSLELFVKHELSEEAIAVLSGLYADPTQGASVWKEFEEIGFDDCDGKWLKIHFKISHYPPVDYLHSDKEVYPMFQLDAIGLVSFVTNYSSIPSKEEDNES